jgi:hypothetical protein
MTLQTLVRTELETAATGHVHFGGVGNTHTLHALGVTDRRVINTTAGLHDIGGARFPADRTVARLPLRSLGLRGRSGLGGFRIGDRPRQGGFRFGRLLQDSGLLLLVLGGILQMTEERGQGGHELDEGSAGIVECPDELDLETPTEVDVGLVIDLVLDAALSVQKLRDPSQRKSHWHPPG